MTSRAALQESLAGRLGSPHEARWMIEDVLRDDAEADEEAVRTLEAMADRRQGGEPLQYVLGSWAFRTLELVVDPRALIPRPETEQVVEVALVEARRQLAAVLPPRSAAVAASPSGSLRPGDPTFLAAGDPTFLVAGDPTFLVADVGTGSGAIALSVAVELGVGDPNSPNLRVIASDADPSALELAQLNRARVDDVHPGVAAAVELVEGSWFDALPGDLRGSFHLVVANPPYVSEQEWAELDPEVRLEPYGALVAGVGSDGTAGFAGVEAVLAGAIDWLGPGGAVVVEMASQHGPAAIALAERAGYADVRVEPDLAGRPRAVVARK